MTAELRSSRRPWIIAVAITLSAGLLYSFTAAREITVGDSPELITVAVTLGVAHPPGYPLFTMLAHFFSLLPLGNIAFRVNLFAAVCHSLTAGVIFLTALRLCRSQLAAAIAVLNPHYQRNLLELVVSGRSSRSTILSRVFSFTCWCDGKSSRSVRRF